MSDYAHNETDTLLSEMESKVFRVYDRATQEMEQKFRKFIAEFEKKDAEKKKLVESGDITETEYREWRANQTLNKKWFNDMIQKLTADMVLTDQIAMQTLNNSLPNVYALNANFATYQLEQDTNMNLSWTLYDEKTVERLLRDDPDLLPQPEVDIPKDERWNRQHINSEITQGILQGESIPKIANRLATVSNMGYNAAVRNARTATTAAECAGRVASYKHAQSRGIELEQEWQSAWDGRVRHEHRLLDGQRVAVGEKFKVNGDEIEYPGDPSAPGYLIYNCRCTLVAALKDYDHDSKQGFSYGDKTYEEWKHELENSQSEVTDVFSYESIQDAIQVGSIQELRQYMTSKYDIILSDTLNQLQLENVKNACYGVEMIITEFPFMNGFIQSIDVTNNDCDGESNGRNIYLNKLKFSNPHYGRVNAVFVGVHESVHCMDLFLATERIKEMYPSNYHLFLDDLARSMITRNKIIANEVANEVYEEIYKIEKYKNYSKRNIRAEVSTYARKNNIEMICDAMAKRAVYGEDIDDVSKIVCRKFIERFEKYA